jgi:ABC-2 type transport system ATP-binding protein
MTDAAVAVRGLTKIFPVPLHRHSIVAVRDLNLRVEPGEVYGLLGPNGSGKSTTLKIILGLVSPTRGRTEIFGRDSRLVESREAVGFLPGRTRTSTNISVARKRCVSLAGSAGSMEPD